MSERRGTPANQRQLLAVGSPGVRVKTLVLLRWVAIVGQLTALMVVGLGLKFPIPWWPTLVAIGASVLLNLGLTWLYPRYERISGRSAMFQLGFDLAQLGVLLFLTGGLLNPFALLLLVPVTIAATMLAFRNAIVLVGMALLILAGLWKWHLPLPWAVNRTDVYLPPLFLFGVLVSIALALLFLTLYTWQVSAEARRHHAALVATQSALDRETRMASLGSLAAAAAHELGGPLGTITLIAKDLDDVLGEDPDLGSDVKLLLQEVRRSREILAGIAHRAEAEDPFPEQPLPVILREAVEQFEPTVVPVGYDLPWAPGTGPVMRRNPELLHGLANIFGNALRHARTRVWVEGGSDDHGVWIAILDDGDGFSAEILPNLGEPFLGPSYSGSGSTGLGVFIATTLIERTGGHLAFANRPEGGARVDISWSHADMEKARETLNEEGNR